MSTIMSFYCAICKKTLLLRSQERHNLSKTHMSKACVSEQPIQSQSFDLNLFLQSGTRSQNDNCNKQREKMLEMMINVPDYVYSDNPEQWNTI